MIQLETDRLILRNGSLTRPTAEQIRAGYEKYVVEYNDPSCSFEVYQDVVLFSYLQAKQGSKFGYYNLVLKGEEQVIGHCNFGTTLCPPEVVAIFGVSGNEFNLHSSLEIEIGWAVSKFYRRKGYATEGAKCLIEYGFKELKLKRMIAFTELSNLASIRVMEKLDMKLTKHPENQAQIIGIIENCQLRP